MDKEEWIRLLNFEDRIWFSLSEAIFAHPENVDYLEAPWNCPDEKVGAIWQQIISEDNREHLAKRVLRRMEMNISARKVTDEAWRQLNSGSSGL